MDNNGDNANYDMNDPEVYDVRFALSRYILNKTYLGGTTHEVAARMLQQYNDGIRREVRLATPSGGPYIAMFEVQFETILDALERLAAIGSELLRTTKHGVLSFVKSAPCRTAHPE